MPQKDLSLKEMADILNQSEHYKVLTKYEKPKFYNPSRDDTKKLIGIFLDIEATGLSAQDKLIELGMVKFEYSLDGRIYCILDEFNAYQDPKIDIPPFITKLTGITNEMVGGKSINQNDVAEYLNNVDLIIAHNAAFDRPFLEKTFKNIPSKAWGCSMFDIDWNNENIESLKLEYIAYKYGFFYEGHRAITDCLVGIHILSKELRNSKQLALKQLLTNAMQPKYIIWAKNSPYERKDLLKARKYRWNMHPTQGIKAWSIELPESKVEAEINYLKSDIFNNNQINIPIDIFDAYSRFSNNTLPHQNMTNTDKYKDKLEWVNNLQQNTKTDVII